MGDHLGADGKPGVARLDDLARKVDTGNDRVDPRDLAVRRGREPVLVVDTGPVTRMTASPSPRSSTEICRTSRTGHAGVAVALGDEAENVAGMLDIKRLQGSGTCPVLYQSQTPRQRAECRVIGWSRNSLPLSTACSRSHPCGMDAAAPATHEARSPRRCARCRSPWSARAHARSPGRSCSRTAPTHRFGGVVVPVNGKYSEIAGVPTVASLSDLDHPAGRGRRTGRHRPRAGHRRGGSVDRCRIGDRPRWRVHRLRGRRHRPGGVAVDARPTSRASRWSDPTAWASSTWSPVPCRTSGRCPAHVRRGRVAAIAQSGAVIEALVNCGGRVPFSTLVSSGAEAVDHHRRLPALLRRRPRDRRGARLHRGLRRCPGRARRRPRGGRGRQDGRCLLSSGRSAKARDGILAHSGKLAPSARVTAAALRQAGVVLAHDLDELITIGEILGTRRRVRGTAPHVVTNSGGEANLLSDLAEDAGLRAPRPHRHGDDAAGRHGGRRSTPPTRSTPGASTTTRRCTQSRSTRSCTRAVTSSSCRRTSR